MQTHHNTSVLPSPDQIAGKKFGHLLILREAARKLRHRRVVYRCDCGIEREVYLVCIVQGITKSCGCMRVPNALVRITGLPKIPEVGIWRGMIRRCEDPLYKEYGNYGGRGIKVCQRWRHSFSSFYEDIGQRPDPKYTIDRVNNDGDYEPGNVRWATQKQQQTNKRTNHLIAYRGETLPVSVWAERCRISTEAVISRLKHGWPVKEALEKPIARGNWVTYGGEKMTIADLAKKYNKKRQTIEGRLRLGWTIEAIIEKPVRCKRKVAKD